MPNRLQVSTFAALLLLCTGCGFKRYYTYETGSPKNPYAGSTVVETETIKVTIKPIWSSSSGSSGYASIFVDLSNKSQRDFTVTNVSIDPCSDLQGDLRFTVDHLEVVGLKAMNTSTGYSQSPFFANYEGIPESAKILAPTKKETDARRLYFTIRTPSHKNLQKEYKSYCIKFNIQILVGEDVQTFQPTYFLQSQSQSYFWFLRDD